MADLTGSSVATTYDQLLTLPSGGGNTTTLVALSDGDGVNTFCLQLATTSALIVDDAKLYFGTGSDASFEYDEDGNDVLLYDGANFRIEDDTQLQFGAAADWTVEYDEDGNDDLVFTGSDMAIESSTSAKPLVIIKNTTNDTTAPTLRFVMDKGAAGADDDDIGTISFYSDNSAQEQTAFASIVAEVSEADDTDEAGKLSFFVSESNGTTAQLTAGLILEGEHATDGEVDVTIGAGAASTTTIAGDLTMTAGDLTMTAGDIKMDGAAGQGIDFSGSQAAADDATSVTGEVLDSYEEGTWTPTFQNASTQAGYYTKIGRHVFCHARMTASGDSGVIFSGLPFTTFNSVNAAGGGSVNYTNQGGEAQTVYVSSNDVYFQLLSAGNTSTEMNADGDRRIAFQYVTSH